MNIILFLQLIMLFVNQPFCVLSAPNHEEEPTGYDYYVDAINNKYSIGTSPTGTKIQTENLTLIKRTHYSFHLNFIYSNFPFKFSSLEDGRSSENWSITYIDGIFTDGASGEVSFQVPSSAPDTLYYFCDWSEPEELVITTFGFSSSAINSSIAGTAVTKLET